MRSHFSFETEMCYANQAFPDSVAEAIAWWLLFCVFRQQGTMKSLNGLGIAAVFVACLIGWSDISVSKEQWEPTGETGRACPYVIQLLSSRDQKWIEKHAAKLQSDGMSVVWGKKRVRGADWYRIFVGCFPSPGKARLYMKLNRLSEKFPGAFVGHGTANGDTRGGNPAPSF